MACFLSYFKRPYNTSTELLLSSRLYRHTRKYIYTLKHTHTKHMVQKKKKRAYNPYAELALNSHVHCHTYTYTHIYTNTPAHTKNADPPIQTYTNTLKYTCYHSHILKHTHKTMCTHSHTRKKHAQVTLKPYITRLHTHTQTHTHTHTHTHTLVQ